MGPELMVVAPPPPTSLAPGFRFHPTDEELVRYYLRRKVCGKPFRFQVVSEIDVYKSEPWELADFSPWNSRDLEWYFFSPVDRKYESGCRVNRTTGQGYWKGTGNDRAVRHKSETIGMKKTLVFHTGRAPYGKRTDWVMHEYRLLDQELHRDKVAQDAFVICRVFQKSGLGPCPPNADRYAPFVEEEWDQDATLFIPEDERTNETCAERNEIVQSNLETISIVHKRERSEDSPLISEPKLRTFSPLHNKRSKASQDPNSINANGSEDSTTTSQDPTTLVEFPLLKDTNPFLALFDASTLEKLVPPGYLKLTRNLENELLDVSMEKETLKIQVMRAQDMIYILQSQIDDLSKENNKLRRGV